MIYFARGKFCVYICIMLNQLGLKIANLFYLLVLFLDKTKIKIPTCRLEIRVSAFANTLEDEGWHLLMNARIRI